MQGIIGEKGMRLKSSAAKLPPRASFVLPSAKAGQNFDAQAGSPALMPFRLKFYFSFVSGVFACIRYIRADCVAQKNQTARVLKPSQFFYI